METVATETASRASAGSPTLVVNSVVKNVMALARRAYQKQRIIAYSGRTGLGKSLAVDYLADALTFPHRIVRCKQTTSVVSLARALAMPDLAPGRTRHLPASHLLYDRAVFEARNERYLLVVDEADRLKGPCFELLRDLWDDARIGILLVGNEDLESIINARHERLARRIGIRMVQADLHREQLREVLAFLGYQFTDEEFTKLYEVCGGSPGWAEAVLNTRNEVALSWGVKPGMEHLLGALKYFPTLAKRQ
jgi:type II secretory pathway predicted ATPase ExeA